MKKTEFEQTFNVIIEDESFSYVMIAVEGVAKYEELIINPRENFQEKLDYYLKTYDDNMRLVHNSKLGITFIMGLTSLNNLPSQVIATVSML